MQDNFKDWIKGVVLYALCLLVEMFLILGTFLILASIYKFLAWILLYKEIDL